MNVIDIESEFTSPDCDGPVFTTADGIIFCISNYSSAYNDEKGTPCDFYNSEPCIQTAGPNLWIDVNGWSKPNKPTNSYDNPKDIYQAQIYSQKVVPYGEPTQQVMYDRKLLLANNIPSSGHGYSSRNESTSSSENENVDESTIQIDLDGESSTYDDVSNVPDEDSPLYDQWDQHKWPSWRDFLNWIKDIILGWFT